MKATFIFGFLLLAFKLLMASLLPVALLEGDSSSFLDIAYALQDGNWPLFHTRPPLYPLFIELVWRVSGNNYFHLVVAQMLLSAVAWSFLFHQLNRLWNRAVLLGAFLFVAANVPLFLFEEFYLLSESLGLSLLLFCFSLVILCLVQPRSRNLIYCTACITLAILCKFALLPLLVIAVPLFILYLKYGFGWRVIALAALIPVLTLIAYSQYNRVTLGTSSIFTFGEFNKLNSVAGLADTCFGSTTDQRSGLRAMKQCMMPNDRQEILAVDEVFYTTPALRLAYNHMAKHIYCYYDALRPAYTPIQIYQSSTGLPAAIAAAYPVHYANFLYNNLLSYLENLSQFKGSFAEKTNNALTFLIQEGSSFMYPAHLSKPAYADNLAVSSQKKHALPMLLDKFFSLVNLCFRQSLWWLIALAAFLLSCVRLLFGRAVASDMIWFCFSGFSLFYLLLVIYSGIATLERYSMYTDLYCYLSLPYLLSFLRIPGMQPKALSR